MSKSKRKAAFKLLQRGKQYPGVHGKVVDFVDHGWGEGMLYIHVRFMDKTEVCWRGCSSDHQGSRSERLEAGRV